MKKFVPFYRQVINGKVRYVLKEDSGPVSAVKKTGAAVVLSSEKRALAKKALKAALPNVNYWLPDNTDGTKGFPLCVVNLTHFEHRDFGTY